MPNHLAYVYVEIGAVPFVRMLQTSSDVLSCLLVAGRNELVKCKSLSTSMSRSGSFIVRIC